MPDGSCDGVLCECVLSLVNEPRQAVGEFSRVLRPGGFLILSDVYDRSADNVAQNESTVSGPCASALRSRPFVEKLLGDSGFGPLAWEDHTRYLKELAAQLILSNESLTEFHDLCAVFDAGCASSAGSLPVRPGYYLLVAQKMTKGEAFHG
jgi:ubiquinone/menaquinone biosynthesis C-methylase UbiE